MMIDPERLELISQCRDYLRYCDKFTGYSRPGYGRMKVYEKVTKIIDEMGLFGSHMEAIRKRENGCYAFWDPTKPTEIRFNAWDESHHNGDSYNEYKERDELPEEYIDQFLARLLPQLKDAAMEFADKEFKSWEDERIEKERQREVEDFLEIRMETLDHD